MVGKLAGFLALTQLALLVGVLSDLDISSMTHARAGCSEVEILDDAEPTLLLQLRSPKGAAQAAQTGLSHRSAGPDAVKRQELVVRDRARKAEIVSQRVSQARLAAEEDLRKVIRLKDEYQKAGFRLQVCSCFLRLSLCSTS